MSEKQRRGRPRKDGVSSKTTPTISDDATNNSGNSDADEISESTNHLNSTESTVSEETATIKSEEKPKIVIPESAKIDPLEGYDPLDDDPLNQPVIERAYTKNDAASNVDPQTLNTEIPEHKVENPQASTTAQADSTKDPTGQPKAKVENRAASEMSTTQKRKEAEKTADAALFYYCKYVPVPFKKWGSFNEKKIEQLAIQDKLNLNMEFKTDRKFTVREYIKEHNKAINKAFDVDDETRLSIREPLIEVLMEQNIILTPTQKLLMAVGSHIGTMAFQALRISQQNSALLEHFQKGYESVKQNNGYNGGDQGGQNQNTEQPRYQQQQANTTSGTTTNTEHKQAEEPAQKNSAGMTMDEVISDDHTDATDSEEDTVTSGDVVSESDYMSADDTVDTNNTEKSRESIIEDAQIVSEIITNPAARKRGRPRKDSQVITLEEAIDEGGNLKEGGEK